MLVDNVRDANYLDPSTPDGQTYIAGFFYSVFNELLDRNVMTIDAFDWLHRTGANPPDDSLRPRVRRVRPVAEPVPSVRRRASAPLRGHVRARVPAPPRVLREPGRSLLGQRGAVRLRTEPGRVRRHQHPAVRPRGRRPHQVLHRLPAAAVRWSGELPDAVGGPGWSGGPVRLRRCVLVHDVSLRPLRRSLHECPAP